MRADSWRTSASSRSASKILREGPAGRLRLGGARAPLQAAGHDVVWAGDWSPDPGDSEILERAHREGRVLVTLDKDFGELAIVHANPHAGIVRLVSFAARQQGLACLRVLATHAEALRAGAIITVDPGRLRIRMPRAE